VRAFYITYMYTWWLDHCFGTDMVYWILLLLKLTVHKLCNFKSKPAFSSINHQLILANLLSHLVLLLPNIFKLFSFTIFRFWEYLVNVITETRRAHEIPWVTKSKLKKSGRHFLTYEQNEQLKSHPKPLNTYKDNQP
jgi:hypothetical protein